MSGRYLLDTCFILALCNNDPDVLAKFGSIPLDNCYFSVVNRIELLGYQDITYQDELYINELLTEMVYLPLSFSVEEETIRLRKQHKIKLPDCLILATAKVHSLELITFDEKLQRIDKQF